MQHADIGPHHRWSTGILFDNIDGDGQLRVQDRLTYGTGHGWAGAQIMLWNCEAKDIVVQDPPSYHCNWAIGCIGPITNIGPLTTHPLAIVESKNIHITAIPSLFLAQLNERLDSLITSVPAEKADRFGLSIHPNPANQQVVISYSLQANSLVKLDLIDECGRKIKTLIPSEKQLAGIHQKTFDLPALKPGIYFARLWVEDSVTTAKLIIQK
jgi:hypothetical protein